jgi:uncharacterized metal-binding protein
LRREVLREEGMSEKNTGLTIIQDTCCSTEAKAVIVACSGGSNVGQVANNAMIELDKGGIGNAYCLAGIGAALSGFIESAKAAKTIVIDGCPTKCGKKAFEKYGITPTQCFVVTEMGIDKNHNFDALSEETARALSYMKEKI